MNKKILIIFLVVIIGFVSYFLVTKVFDSFEERLCERNGGEWFSKDIWEIGDTCEFVYLQLDNIPYYYSLYENEKYFDDDEPNEDFYLQSEKVQAYAIEAKELVSFLGEEYQNFYYNSSHNNFFDDDEPNEFFYSLPEDYQINIIKARKLIPLLEEKYEKEINIAKKYCMEVGGRFGQSVVDFKKLTGKKYLAAIMDHWVVRCYIE